MQNEIWRDISEFKGFYQISNMGRVRRIADYSNQNSHWKLKEPRILNNRVSSTGYLRVVLSINGKHYDRYIHRLVANEFVDNPYGYKEVNHLDGDKTNNKADNLEWCTRSQNNSHAYKIGLKQVSGCCGKLKKKVAQIDTKTNKITRIFESIDSVSKEFNCNHSSVTNCCMKRFKTLKGFKWRFAVGCMKVGDVVID